VQVRYITQKLAGPRRRNSRQETQNRSDSMPTDPPKRSVESGRSSVILLTNTHQKTIAATEEEANSSGGPNAQGPSGIWKQRASQIPLNPDPDPDPDPVARSRAPSPGLDRSGCLGGRRVGGISPRFWSGRAGGSRGNHGVGAGVLLHRRAVAQGPPRGREEAGRSVVACCSREM
jgi:hypothetical protein